MIYFQPVLQKTLFGIFHSVLKDGGYLFLGKSESANDVSDVFVPVCGTERIYAHVGEGKMPDTLASSFSVQLPPTPTNNGSALHDVREDGEQVDKLYSTFLERFLPPSVVIDELIDTTNDLTNFLSSTMIGILFLDNNLNIRKFTEYVGREFNIMSHDVGRSIQIIAHMFQDVDIVDAAEAVLRSLMPIDKEVTTVDGKNYTLRIAPYRTTENSIESLVLTIIDSIGER